MGSLRWDQIDVSSWAVAEVEQEGSTPVQWLLEPGTPKHWLHKDTVIPANGIEQGEDWAEVVATQVAVALQVPCAATMMCLRNGRRGSLSLNVAPDGHSLSEGRVLLSTADGVSGYFPHTEDRKGSDPQRPEVLRPGHSLTNIRTALTGFEAPPDFSGPGEMDAFDVFAGYMLLDALIANRDRHEQNWAVLIPALTQPQPRLAPSYDHAGALGYNLTDEGRQHQLRSKSALRRWAGKGTAHRYEHELGTAPTLVKHASRALGLTSPEAQLWWREIVSSDCLDSVIGALSDRDVPGMSVLASTFARDMLELNLRRLHDELDSSAQSSHLWDD